MARRAGAAGRPTGGAHLAGGTRLAGGLRRSPRPQRRRGRGPRGLYVETVIRADLNELWRLTQDPGQHQRWDLRFTRIDYLPSVAGAASQQFRYQTRLLPGVHVAGVGACSGERLRPDGTRTSVLRFRSDQRLSLIRAGTGYWRYVPTPDGIRFLTGYDYEPRWGWLGRAADLVFRPVMGWATAWSFDRLRIWLEDGVPPERSLRRGIADVGIRLGCSAGAWLATPAPVAALLTCVAALVPPMPGTPAARRCARRPPRPRPATSPAEALAEATMLLEGRR